MNGASLRRSAVASSDQVRLHARRAALTASALALVVYLVGCVIADLLVLDHLSAAIDARLVSRLSSLQHTVPRELHAGLPSPVRFAPTDDDSDLDDAPVLAWFVPAGSSVATRLSAGAPALPRREDGVRQPTDATLASEGLRLDGTAVSGGRVVVATSTQQEHGILTTLLIIEGSLAPVALLTLFAAATIIGRRAAAPIEQVRLHQLEFTADASHELRTPLTVIEAEVGLALANQRSAAEYRSALARVADESQRLSRIVDDLLWLARLDSLPRAPSPDSVDMGAIVRTCVDRFATVAKERSLALTSHPEEDPAPIVVAPAEWLDRLVSVLLDNACRYVDPGGRIDVSLTARGERVVLTVDDDGPGFAVAQRETLLQRFHRASPQPGGAGLGLAIARAVVGATHGELRLEAAPLGGARVEVSWRRCATTDSIRTTSGRRGRAPSSVQR